MLLPCGHNGKIPILDVPDVPCRRYLRISRCCNLIPMIVGPCDLLWHPWNS